MARKPKTVWHRATPEQLARADELADLWRVQAGHPIVAIGAATSVLINTIHRDVPVEYHPATIEAIYTELQQMLGEG
jgi:hypothetical protein